MTFYSVTVDTEEEWIWDHGWPSTKPSVTNIAKLADFQDLCDRHGAAVTYFTNHAVMNDQEARDSLMELAERPSVEIGMHIHPWNTPPLVRHTLTDAEASFLANHADDVVASKLQTVYESFQQAGLEPRSFRGGRYSSGGAVHRFLREKRFMVDASVVPFTTWHDRGAPDYRHRDLTPYRHAPDEEFDVPLWELPLTLGYTRHPFPFWRRAFEIVEFTPLRHLRLIGIAEKIGLVRRVWLNLEDPLGRNMLPFLRMLRRMQLPSICFTLHSSSLLVGGNGCYTTSEQERQKLLQRAEQVLELISGWNEFESATMTQTAQQLEENDDACAWN